MPLTCPRCGVPMDVVRAAPHIGGVAVDLDLCGKCNGLWIDGPKLAAVCPTVSDLPSRSLEIALLGRRGGGIATCPRCQAVPYEFLVIDIPVDFCAGCTGVWLDGDEYGEVDFERPPTADAPRGGPYRASAGRALRSGQVKCAGCDAKVALRSTYMWERGLICGRCHADKLQRAASRRATGTASGDLAEGFLTLLAEGLGDRRA